MFCAASRRANLSLSRVIPVAAVTGILRSLAWVWGDECRSLYSSVVLVGIVCVVSNQLS